MEKAFLDYKDIQPDAIIDELTNYENIMKGENIVGYMEDIPVAFSWNGNLMEIRNIYNKKPNAFQSRLNEYFGELLRNSNVLAKATFVDNNCFIHFYWAE